MEVIWLQISKARYAKQVAALWSEVGGGCGERSQSFYRDSIELTLDGFIK